MKRICLYMALVLLLSAAGCTAIAEEAGILVIGENDAQQATQSEGTELKPGDKIKIDGDYTISLPDPAAKCYSHDDDLHAVAIGYLTSKDDGSAGDFILGPVGTHTILRVYSEMLNRSKQETNWLKRMKCEVVFDDCYIFETLPVQYNPDQLRYDGATGYSSIEPRPAEPLVSVKIGFFVSVPYIVRDSDKPLWAYITVDNDVYAVNLREAMVIG